jgi:hypothetical protein
MTKDKTKLPKNYNVIIDEEQITDLLKLCDETCTMKVIKEGKVWH